MLGFEDDHGSLRGQCLHEAVGDLAGHPFLDLGSTGIGLDDPT